MIELRHVSYSFDGKAALTDVSLELRPGECVAVVGPNASGKSTLAKVLDGLLLPQGGECIVDGVSTHADPLRARLRVGLVFQDPDDQAVSRRVDDDVAFGPLNLGMPDVDARVGAALEAVGIGHLSGRDIRTLSGGQKQLVAIAGVLAMSPAYVVLDEPTALLDQEGTGAVLKAVAALKAAGKGLLIVTHDPVVARVADRILLLKAGQLTALGADAGASDGLEPPELARLWNRLKELGIVPVRADLSVDGAAEVLCRLRQKV